MSSRRRRHPLPSTMTFLSPDRRWRAGSCLVAAAWLGHDLASGPSSPNGTIIGVLLVAGLLVVAWRIFHKRLTVDETGLTDERITSVRHIEWSEISELTVGRPSGLWGGYCVQAVRHDGEVFDVLALRAYRLSPSAWHLDELHRAVWTMHAMATSRI